PQRRAGRRDTGVEKEERTVIKMMSVICLFLIVASSFGQSPRHYQVAVIVGVKPHQTGANDSSDATSYEVSLKVDDIVYVVLYTPPLGITTVKYAEGLNLLVLVGEKTVSYNDLLGQTFEVPIISRKRAGDVTKAK
ncbi:MAG: hypothetical protein WBX22_32800, partial [Silvibacterium sp.]